MPRELFSGKLWSLFDKTFVVFLIFDQMKKGYLFLNDDLEMNKGRWHLWTRQPVTVGTMLNFGREARVSKVVSVNLLLIILNVTIIIIIILNVIIIIIAITIIKIISIMASWHSIIVENSHP